MISKRKLLNASLALIFTAFEVLMFYLIHFEKAELGFNLYYTSIIGAAIFSLLTLMIKLITAKDENQRISEVLFNASEGNLILIAMMFTLAADYYLVFLPTGMELQGVSVFLGTQLFIFLHIMANDREPRSRRVHLITRIALTAILVIVAYVILGGNTDTLAIVSVIYYANLLANVCFAHRSGRGGIILTVGLILFALCDINVGLSALNSLYVGGFPEGSLLYELINSDVELIWVFYIPSQTLIPMTIMLCDDKRK